MKEIIIFDKVLKTLDVINEVDLKNKINKIIKKIIKYSEKNGYGGNLVENYFSHIILYKKNIFSELCAAKEIEKVNIMKKSIIKEIDEIKILISKLGSEIKNRGYEYIFDYGKSKNNINIFENKNIDEIVEFLMKFYSENGSGEVSKGRFFKWNEKKNKIVNIVNVDKITFDDLVGYSYQKDEIIQNTAAFVEGKSANNVLLTGSRGTGKSSMVKASINKYYKKGLVCVEIQKEQCEKLDIIMKKLAKIKKRIILFIDDLSFEDSEMGYKKLKSVLEGGVEQKAENILIYATSNRRHLIKETFSERSSNDEVSKNDSINEKLSLADRFGLNIYFSSPTQQEYLDIVYELAEKKGLNISKEKLKELAIKWEISQNGRSGRSAVQFLQSCHI